LLEGGAGGAQDLAFGVGRIEDAFFVGGKAAGEPGVGEETTTPASSMIALMSSMKALSFKRLAWSWFFTSPGIRVELNCGCLPEA